MSDTVRVPIQQRSIDKKNRIIEAGYSLFAENGYFNTNTVDIAKRAGVSTGIVYGYFRDKRDILLEVLDIYIDNVFRPILEMLDGINAPLDFDKIIPRVVDSAVETHKQNAAIHEALHSLTPTDKAVNEKFLALEAEMTQKMVARLTSLGYVGTDLSERVHLTIETIQSYAHECVYDKHSYINYTKMRDILITMLESLFPQI
jgi:AcrR family transcriptional regulator